MVTRYDPRAPNIAEGLRMLEEVLYLNQDNQRVFPKGTIMAGFRRGRNLGEIIAPTKPRRERREVEEPGSVRCSSRRCLLHDSGALQEVRRIRSRRDQQEWLLPRRVECSTPNLVYYILCPCGWRAGPGSPEGADYVGSTRDFKSRWSSHKSDIKNGRWTACGLTRHFGNCHQGDWREAVARLRVVLLDCLPGTLDEDRLRNLEQTWMHRLGTVYIGCNSRVELTSSNRRTWGNS